VASFPGPAAAVGLRKLPISSSAWTPASPSMKPPPIWVPPRYRPCWRPSPCPSCPKGSFGETFLLVFPSAAELTRSASSTARSHSSAAACALRYIWFVHGIPRHQFPQKNS
jgi:hypothetical protein